MRAGLAAAAFLAVVLGAVVGYGWGAPGSGTLIWTVALAVMLAGTAVLAAVLIRTMAGLHRTKAPLPPEQTHRPDPVELSQSATRHNGAAIRRYRDGAELPF